MQQRCERQKGKNYKIRELQSGELQIEIRRTEYGYETKRLPVGTTPTHAHKHARKMLNDLANADVPELARTVLGKFTLDEWIEAFLKAEDISKRERDFIRSFQRNNPSLYSKTFNDNHAIVKGLDSYINKRKKEDIVRFTITKSLSKLRTMYRNAGKKLRTTH